MTQKCARCGTENKDDIVFCVYCGASLSEKPAEAPTPAAPGVPASAIKPIPPALRERHPDFVGLIGVAFFLLIVGIVFMLNSNLLADARRWWDRIVAQGLFVRPPEGIITSAALFFALVGLSNFLTSGLRWILDRSRFGALARVLSGIGFLFLAYLFTLYANRSISGPLVISAWAAVLGTLLVVYIAIGLYWVRVRRPVPAGAQAPTNRP